VVTPNFVDYSEFDKYHRAGIPGFILSYFSENTNEYLKTISRWLLGKDVLQSKKYLWTGQKKSIHEVLKNSSWLLPNSNMEIQALKKKFSFNCAHTVIPNGIDTSVFHFENGNVKDDALVVCAARIEGIKNQLNLIQALNNTPFTLMIIGGAAPNHSSYYEACKKIAAKNVLFPGKLTQPELAGWYKKAKVHVLPSWFETCGLSSLEAAAMGCNIVVTDKGYAREYFGDCAFYCDPSSPDSIYSAIVKANDSTKMGELQNKILNTYTWPNAAMMTLETYKKILN
jgi:glycosyltransferase involved in cell wall biosynthesis